MRSDLCFGATAAVMREFALMSRVTAEAAPGGDLTRLHGASDHAEVTMRAVTG